MTSNNPTKRCSSLGARSRLTHSSSVASRLAEALGASEGAEDDVTFSVATLGGVPSGTTAPDMLCVPWCFITDATTTRCGRAQHSGCTVLRAVVQCGEASGRCVQLCRLQRRGGESNGKAEPYRGYVTG